MYYSAKNNGFFPTLKYAKNGFDLSDAVEITPEQHVALLQGQSEGKQISADENGYPILVDLPEPEPLPPQYPKFTALEMLDLFTEPEQLAVVNATMTNAAVKLWYDRMIAATFVTYEDPRTEGGLQALVDAGLLTAERKAKIVAAMLPEGMAPPPAESAPEPIPDPAPEQP